MNELSLIYAETPDLVRDFEGINIDWFDVYYEESQLAHHDNAVLMPFEAFANNLATQYISQTSGVARNKRFQYDPPAIYNALVVHQLTFELEGRPHHTARGGGFTCTKSPSLAPPTTMSETSSDS